MCTASEQYDVFAAKDSISFTSLLYTRHGKLEYFALRQRKATVAYGRGDPSPTVYGAVALMQYSV